MQDRSYHSKEGHDARLSHPMAHPVVPSPFHVYYHAALMPGWQSIVEEQFRVFAFVGVRKLYSGCIGSKEPVAGLQALAVKHGIDLNIVSLTEFFDEYEMPTIRPLWQHACREPSAAFMYTHTKGASVQRTSARSSGDGS